MLTISNEKKPDAISEGLSRVYDLAIDHAIAIVDVERLTNDSKEMEKTLRHISDKLKLLKK